MKSPTTMSSTAVAPPAESPQPQPQPQGTAAPAAPAAPAARAPVSAATGVNVAPEELRRLTAALCRLNDGTEGERSVVDTALVTARAFDRWVRACRVRACVC